MIHEESDRAFARIVTEDACRRIVKIQAGDVAMSRIGARTFGTVSMLTVAVIVSSTLLSNIAGTRANTPGSSVDLFNRLISPEAAVPNRTTVASFKGSNGSPVEGASSLLNPSAATESMSKPVDPAAIQASTTSEARGDARSSSSNGTGSGAATSRSATVLNRSMQPDVDLANAEFFPPINDAQIARRARKSGLHSTASPGMSDDPFAVRPAGQVKQERAMPSKAVWQSQGWRDARERALSDVQTGQIPEEYRALVREYFDPR